MHKLPLFMLRLVCFLVPPQVCSKGIAFNLILILSNAKPSNSPSRVALNRLPTSASSSPLLGPHSHLPLLSNTLVTAFKRAHAHQHRGSTENQQQPAVLALKVEIKQLVISNRGGLVLYLGDLDWVSDIWSKNGGEQRKHYCYNNNSNYYESYQ
ncbi:hypothetical protein OROMI_034002 [Orobanche minor]